MALQSSVGWVPVCCLIFNACTCFSAAILATPIIPNRLSSLEFAAPKRTESHPLQPSCKIDTLSASDLTNTGFQMFNGITVGVIVIVPQFHSWLFRTIAEQAQKCDAQFASSFTQASFHLAEFLLSLGFLDGRQCQKLFKSTTHLVRAKMTNPKNSA